MKRDELKALLDGGSGEALRELLQVMVQEVLEAEMSDALAAEKGERTGARVGYRSGYYTRKLTTRVGTMELRVPQDRDGRFSTKLFESYQRSERAFVGALCQMYVEGVSTGRGGARSSAWSWPSAGARRAGATSSRA